VIYLGNWRYTYDFVPLHTDLNRHYSPASYIWLNEKLHVIYPLFLFMGKSLDSIKKFGRRIVIVIGVMNMDVKIE
jgi:hypothetical protein